MLNEVKGNKKQPTKICKRGTSSVANKRLHFGIILTIVSKEVIHHSYFVVKQSIF